MKRFTRPAAALMTAIALAATGCGQPADYAPTSGGDVEHDHSHDHEYGPHDGHLMVLKPETEDALHAELVFDEELRVTTIYILSENNEEETLLPFPIDATEIVFHLHEHDDHDHGDHDDDEARLERNGVRLYFVSTTDEEAEADSPEEGDSPDEGESAPEGEDDTEAEDDTEPDEDGDEDVHEEVELVFVPVYADGAETTAKFELPADQLPDHIDNEEMFAGHVHVSIGDKAFVGNLVHDHDH